MDPDIIISDRRSWELAHNKKLLSSSQTTSSPSIMLSDRESWEAARSKKLLSSQAKGNDMEIIISDKSSCESTRDKKTAYRAICSLVVCNELAIDGRTGCSTHIGSPRTPWWMKGVSSKVKVTEPEKAEVLTEVGDSDEEIECNCPKCQSEESRSTPPVS
ncbi:hypothetical protein RRF57_000920 [Xylaria bambusicola]|uniref:Uncharacterized protein n=1 Tax=Xylaria bambusicola TaxID=326684 RepID=A0AAN7UPJ2_9PEZI